MDLEDDPVPEGADGDELIGGRRMLSFVKINETTGVWANRDKAMEYLWSGYAVYTDETMETEVTQEDLDSMVEEFTSTLNKSAEG